MDDRLLAWADFFLPQGEREVELVRSIRVAAAQAFVGIGFTIVMGALYASMGSPLSALAIASVGIGLAAALWLLRRGVSVFKVSNAMVGLTYCATLGVSLRSGGFAAPSVVWLLLLPPSVYAVCGLRSALVWSVAAAVQVGGLYGISAIGVELPQDLQPMAAATLQLIGYAGALSALLALLLVLDSARRAASRALRDVERTLDRQRILYDMHDGVGSHLLGLLVECRAGTLREPELCAGLETCLDELRLIVDSLDALHASLDAGLGALRARLSARCEGLGVELAWEVSPSVVASFEPADGMQLLRALQEMVANALRHSGTARIDVRLGARDGEAAAGAGIELSVRDYGHGLRPLGPEEKGRGRGLKSLQLRSRKLGGALRIEPQQPGLRVAIELPAAPPNLRDFEAARDRL